MKKRKILFLCDRKRCETCNDFCEHTSDIRHAANFEIIAEENIFIERADRDAPSGTNETGAAAKPLTNYEKIKAMSAYEMAKWVDSLMGGCACCTNRHTETCNRKNCKKGIKQWLESEAE